MRFPRVAYVLHWFPEPTETFIYNEVIKLEEMGLPLKVYTLYGRLTTNISRHMLSAPIPVERFGFSCLSRLGHDLCFWKRWNPAAFKMLFRHVPWRRWNDLENTGENLWAFLCGFRLARLFQRDYVEHIHAPWANGPATAGWVASELTGIPFSLAVHATDIYPPDGALGEKAAHCTFIRSENRANADFLACMHETKLYRSKLHVIYSGHPLGESPPAPAPMVPPYRVLALGRLVRKKGFDILIRACRLLRERDLNLQLIIGGEGRCRPGLEDLTSRLGLRGYVQFRGFIPQEDVPDFLRSGDIFVMPSVVDASGDRDGLPNVVIEALLSRLPVIASNVCAIPEIIRDGETGFLVPQGNPAALAEAVLKTVRDRTRALEMAENGRQLVWRQFDLKKSCERMLRLFQVHSAPMSTSPADRTTHLG